MIPQKTLLLIITILVMALAAAACSKPPEATEAAPTSAAPMTTQEGGATTEPAAPPTSSPSGVPEDVPIMSEAYDLQIPNQLNINYKVNLPIKDVVTFYEEIFEDYGWDIMNNPDSVVGSMAQMSRANAKGDRLIFSLQFNPVGEFTIVQIFITRKP